MILLLKLYGIYLYFGSICLSGGNILLQFYIEIFVNKLNWMTLEQFGNFLAISQITPGPLGLNLATFVGHTIGGTAGGLVCTFGLLTPSIILMTLAVRSYNRWLQTRLVRSLFFMIKPATASLVVCAFIAILGMSIFTSPIPIDWFVGFCQGSTHSFPANFALEWRSIPIFIFAFWAVQTRKVKIPIVVLVSAAAGALLALV